MPALLAAEGVLDGAFDFGENSAEAARPLFIKFGEAKRSGNRIWFGLDFGASAFENFKDFEMEAARHPSVGSGVVELLRGKIGVPIRHLGGFGNALAEEEGGEVFHPRVDDAHPTCVIGDVYKARRLEIHTRRKRANIAPDGKPSLYDVGIFENFVDVRKARFERFEPENPRLRRARKLQNGNFIMLFFGKAWTRFGIETENAFGGDFGQNAVELVGRLDENDFVGALDNGQLRD